MAESAFTASSSGCSAGPEAQCVQSSEDRSWSRPFAVTQPFTRDSRRRGSRRSQAVGGSYRSSRREQCPREALRVARNKAKLPPIQEEEGARVQEAVPSSFAKPDKTDEQTKVRIVVPAEVPRDARNSIEDLVYTDIESDVDELRGVAQQGKDNEKKVKQPGAGTQEPKKKQTARGWDPWTLERQEQCQLQANKASLSSQCWARCTQPRTAHFPRQREREMKSELSEAKHKEVHQVLQGQNEAFDARVTPEVWVMEVPHDESTSFGIEVEYDADWAPALESQSSDRIPKSDVVKDTMSTTLKLAKEIDEPDISKPTAECQLMTPSERSLFTQGCELQTVQGGAEDTDERVMTSHTEMCEGCEVTSVEEGYDVERVDYAGTTRLLGV